MRHFHTSSCTLFLTVFVKLFGWRYVRVVSHCDFILRTFVCFSVDFLVGNVARFCFNSERFSVTLTRKYFNVSVLLHEYTAEINMNKKQVSGDNDLYDDRTTEDAENHVQLAAGDAAVLAEKDDQAATQTTRLYKRRWIIVLLFSFYSLSNSFQWIQYGIINNIFMRFYGVDAFTIDWMSMIYMLTYIPFVFPVTWLLDKKGLRVIALIATTLNCAGTWIKVTSAKPNLFAVTFLGQFCCSLAQVFILGMPAKIASMWFGSNEVSTACSIGVFGNQVRLTLLNPQLFWPSDP